MTHDDDVAALLRLGEACAPEDAPAEWGAWRAEVRAVADLDPGPEAERRLDELEGRLRLLWSRHARGFTDALYRSPPLGTPMRLPFGRASTHSYERNIECHVLEDRLAEQVPVPDGHDVAHVGYASCMAALAGLLQSYQGLVRPTANHPLRLGMWGAYFETTVLLDLLSDDCLQWRRLHTQGDLRAATAAGETDVLLLEPVSYEWELEILDLAALLRAWRRRRGARPGLVIVDTTLVSVSWPMRRLVEAIGAPGVLLAEVRSGLKLDQCGLELGNLGVVSLYRSQDDRNAPPVADIATYLRKMRTITGSGPSLDTLALLSAPFVLDRATTLDHVRRVFRNNALAARMLAERDGLFSRFTHPSRSTNWDLPWAQAPFVVGHLREDRLDNHGFLLGVLREEARQRGLPFVHGSSFGFRGHRFECIIPSLKEGRGLFKVAMGARSGWGRAAVLGLLLEVAGYPDFAALRAAYPDVHPVDLTNLE